MTVPARRKSGRKADSAAVRRRIPRIIYGWIAAGAVGGAVAAIAHNWERISPTPPGRQMTVYRRHGCPCYGPWVRHLEQEGFSVRGLEVRQLESARARVGDSVENPGCHFGIAGGYFIEGHVPASDIKRLLAEQPTARGIAIIGSPRGLPGLKPAGPPDPYEVLLYREGGHTEVWARHNGSRPSDPETK